MRNIVKEAQRKYMLKILAIQKQIDELIEKKERYIDKLNMEIKNDKKIL